MCAEEGTYLVVRAGTGWGIGTDDERDGLGDIRYTLCTSPCRDADETLQALGGAHAILLFGAVHLPRHVVDKLRRCRVIVRYGVGVDNVDVEACTRAGIIVATVPDTSTDDVATHAIALLLACARRIVELDRRIRAGHWDRQSLAPMGRVSGKTLGLVGFGRIGQAVARKAIGLGLRVTACDPIARLESFSDLGVTPSTLGDLLASSDYVSLHVPLTDATRHLLSDPEFAAMKAHAVVVNTSRGPIVDEAALIRALETGQIAAAGLDVMEVEPLPATSPLRRLDNVILTPHAAQYSDEGIRELCYRVGREAGTALRGGWPTSVVNPEVRARLRTGSAVQRSSELT